MPLSANFRILITQVPELSCAGSSNNHCADCTHSLGPAESNAGDTLDVLQTELANGLACLLLVARVHSDGGSCGDARLGLGLAIGVRVRVCVLYLDVLLLGLVREFLNAWVGHVDGDVWGESRYGAQFDFRNAGAKWLVLWSKRASRFQLNATSRDRPRCAPSNENSISTTWNAFLIGTTHKTQNCHSAKPTTCLFGSNFPGQITYQTSTPNPDIILFTAVQYYWATVKGTQFTSVTISRCLRHVVQKPDINYRNANVGFMNFGI